MDILSPNELEKLLELVGGIASTFRQTETAFRAAFREEEYAKISLGIQFLRRDASLLVVGETYCETINALWLLDVMRRSTSANAEGIASAKAVFFEVLYHLELLLREDARKAESTKYRATTKEGGAGQAGGPTKRSATDVTESEAMRCRSATKLFGLQCLAGKVTSDGSPATLLAADQLAIDNALDLWQKNSTDIKETLHEIAHVAEMESERNSLGTLSRMGVPAYSATAASGIAASSTTRPLLGLQLLAPAVARAPLPAMVTDIRYLLGSAAFPQQLLFDHQWHSKEWRTAKDLVRAASQGPLTPQQQVEATQSMTTSTIPRLGISAPLMCSIATHNPEVAATVLNKIKDPAALLEAILSSSAPADHMETVMLHCVKSLRQIHVYKYVAASLARARSPTSSPAATKELVVNLASTLHQLITKFSKDNKELYVNDNQKAELGKLFEEHASVPEVSSRWADLK